MGGSHNFFENDAQQLVSIRRPAPFHAAFVFAVAISAAVGKQTVPAGRRRLNIGIGTWKSLAL